MSHWTDEQILSFTYEQERRRFLDTQEQFEQWGSLKQNMHHFGVQGKFRQGEIRWCRIGMNIGYEIFGKGAYFKRPVLIMKKYSANIFFGAPLTTKKHVGDWYYSLDHNGQTRYVVLNQARVFDVKRLEQKMYELNEFELFRVKQAFCRLIIS